MRFKVFGLFLAVQFLSIALWYTFEQNDPSALQASAAAPETFLDLPLKQPEAEIDSTRSANSPSPSSSPLKENNSVKITVQNWDDQYQELYESQFATIEQVAKALPQNHTAHLEVVLDYDPEAYRGWGGKNIVILAATAMSSEEMMAVLLHEVGHHVDAAFLQSSQEKWPSPYHDGKKILYNDDPSVAFYNLSWLADSERRFTQSSSDAVSGYALTNPHEDFAETYAFYVLHQTEFEALSKTDSVLAQKYDFMKNVVFGGREFESVLSSPQAEKLPWDVTKLPYNLNTFLLMNG